MNVQVEHYLMKSKEKNLMARGLCERVYSQQTESRFFLRKNEYPYWDSLKNKRYKLVAIAVTDEEYQTILDAPTIDDESDPDEATNYLRIIKNIAIFFVIMYLLPPVILFVVLLWNYAYIVKIFGPYIGLNI